MARSTKRIGALFALVLTLAPRPTTARPYTIDDFLKAEEFGRISLAPGGRWLVFERRIPRDAAPQFGLGAMNEIRDRLYVADLDQPGQAKPLVALPSHAATVALGFSPRGTRIAIGKLEGGTWTLGVVTLATGAVCWFPVVPDYDGFRPTLSWISEDALVTIAEPREALPWRLRMDGASRDRLPALWEEQRTGGGPTVTAVGSGASQSVTPPRPTVELLRVDVETGATKVLARRSFHALVAAPGGKAVALIENGAVNAVAPGALALGGMEPNRWMLRLLDPGTGESWSPCDECDLPFDPPSWSPDGTRLLVFAHRHGVGWDKGEMLFVDVAGKRMIRLELGDLKPVLGGLPNTYATVSTGWSGGRPVVLARDPAGAQRWYALSGGAPVAMTRALAAPSADLAAGRQALAVDDGKAWRLGGEGRSAFKAGVAEIVGGPGDSRSVIATDRRPDRSFVTFSGTREAVALPTDATPIALAPARGMVIARVPEADGSEALVAAGPRSTQVLARINEGRGDIERAEPVALHYRLSDGQRVTSWLYVPPGAQGRRLPLVTIGYPGLVYGDAPPSRDGRMLGANNHEVAALVGHGYGVLMASMPRLAPSSDHPFDFAGQLVPAVDAAIATGRVDPRQIGLWGHSFGGYMVATTLAETDRFTAAIAAHGIYDLVASQGIFAPTTRVAPEQGQSPLIWAGWAETGALGLGATAWSDTRRYVVNSPVYRADRIRTALLLLAGDQDPAPLQQSEEMYSALYRFAKDAELRTYWGEEHAPMSPANVRDEFTSACAWFDRHFAEAAAR